MRRRFITGCLAIVLVFGHHDYLRANPSGGGSAQESDIDVVRELLKRLQLIERRLDALEKRIPDLEGLEQSKSMAGVPLKRVEFTVSVSGSSSFWVQYDPDVRLYLLYEKEIVAAAQVKTSVTWIEVDGLGLFAADCTKIAFQFEVRDSPGRVAVDVDARGLDADGLAVPLVAAWSGVLEKGIAPPSFGVARRFCDAWERRVGGPSASPSPR